MIPMTLTKPLMVPCPHMLPPPLPYSRCTLTGISVMRSSLASSQTGFVRDISFYNKDFLDAHPDILIGKKSDSPDEDKSPADSMALIPVLKDFFRKHPLINSKTFLGDASFDSAEIYKYLLEETSIEKAYIPLNKRISLPDADCPLNKDGSPAVLKILPFR